MGPERRRYRSFSRPRLEETRTLLKKLKGQQLEMETAACELSASRLTATCVASVPVPGGLSVASGVCAERAATEMELRVRRSARQEHPAGHHHASLRLQVSTTGSRTTSSSPPALGPVGLIRFLIRLDHNIISAWTAFRDELCMIVGARGLFQGSATALHGRRCSSVHAYDCGCARTRSSVSVAPLLSSALRASRHQFAGNGRVIHDS